MSRPSSSISNISRRPFAAPRGLATGVVLAFSLACSPGLVAQTGDYAGAERSNPEARAAVREWLQEAEALIEETRAMLTDERVDYADSRRIDGTVLVLFRQLDRNDDRVLDLAEAQSIAIVARNYGELDRNADGLVNLPEFRSITRTEPRELEGTILVLFRQLDEDSDSLLTEKEAEPVPIISRSYPELDENADGRLTMAEFTTILNGR